MLFRSIRVKSSRQSRRHLIRENYSDKADRRDEDMHAGDTVQEKLSMRVKLKNTEFLNLGFTSALEKMADFENIPEDVFEGISDAIKHYDSSIFNDELLYKKRKGLLN